MTPQDRVRLPSPVAAPQAALAELSARYGNVPIAKADVIVALGGDGFMLQTLHATQHIDLPVYGMNRGTVGFLLNAYAVDGLYEKACCGRDGAAEPARYARRKGGRKRCAGTGNKRGVRCCGKGRRRAKLRILVDGRERLPELIRAMRR